MKMLKRVNYMLAMKVEERTNYPKKVNSLKSRRRENRKRRYRSLKSLLVE